MNIKRGNIFIAFILLLALAAAVGAYELKTARWPSNAANYKCDSSLSSAFCDSVKYGADRWNGVSGSPFRWFYSSNSQSEAKLGTIDGSRGTVGRCSITRVPGNSSFLQKVVVIFDNKEKWYTGSGSPSSSQYDARSIAAHEMGHCLGLEHTQSSNCGSRVDEDDKPSMCEGSPFYDGETYVRSLETDDKNGVKARYPQQSSTSLAVLIPPAEQTIDLDAARCDMSLFDMDSFYAVLSPRQRLRYSDVIVRGTVINVTETRFNSNDNCSWEDETGSWTLFYTIELSDVEVLRAVGKDVGDTLTITIQEKNPLEIGHEPLVEEGQEIMAFLRSGELSWYQEEPREAYYPASSPKTSFLIKASDELFYEAIPDDHDEGQTFSQVQKAVKEREYHPE